MTVKAISGHVAGVNGARIVVLAALVAVLTLLGIEPAYAFDGLASNIVGKSETVATAFKAILFAAAVISVLAGAAPMLWGEVRVKWMVSALVACTIISMISTLVNAFMHS